jgi:hypothetical protein
VSSWSYKPTYNCGVDPSFQPAKNYLRYQPASKMVSYGAYTWDICEGLWWLPKLFLVGGVPTPLKNMKVSWDDYSQYMER